MTLWPPAGMTQRYIDVLDSVLAFVETEPAGTAGIGEAAPKDEPLPVMLFLHGNPTSSFLWRHVPTELSGEVHAIAVDLIGMGRSGKPAGAYALADHRRYLDAFVDQRGLRDVVVVGHDWGAVLGLDLAVRRPEVVSSIAVCEGHLHPFARWTDMDEGSRGLFSRLRTAGIGQQLVINENFFVDVVLPAGMTHKLTREEWAEYRAPFTRVQDRWPILRWVQQIPIEGEPADVVETVLANQTVLLQAKIPRLLMYGEPGSVVGAAEIEWAKRKADGLTVAGVGAGTHFLPEDCAPAIARALRTWLAQSA